MGKEVTKKTETAIAPRAVSPLNVLGSRFNIEPAKLMEVLRGTPHCFERLPIDSGLWCGARWEFWSPLDRHWPSGERFP